MAFIKKYFLNCYMLLFFTTLTYAQRIQNFNVFVAGTSVGIKFTIGTGAQCGGYKIYHSLDSSIFNQIYDYPGTCGNSSTPQDISYTHTNPAINQTNYYKVELVPVETSLIKRVFVPNVINAKLFVYPNPIVQIYDLLNLKISNIGSTRLVGFISSQFGNPLKQIDITTQGDLAAINVYDLTNGLYVIWLTDGVKAYSSKFIIVR